MQPEADARSGTARWSNSSVEIGDAASRTSRASGRAPRRCSRRGSCSLEALLVLERRVALRERHRSPSRTRRRSPRARAASARRTAGTGTSTSSTNGPVRVLERARRDSSSSSANEPMHVDVAVVVAAPDRQRRAPVALARRAPSRRCSRSQLPKRPSLDVLRVPVDRLVGRQQRVAQRRRARCTRTAWRSRAAACRSASSAGRSARSVSARSSRPRARRSSIEVGVGVLDEAPGVRADALVVGAVEPHRVDDVQAVLLRRAGSRPRRRRSRCGRCRCRPRW